MVLSLALACTLRLATWPHSKVSSLGIVISLHPELCACTHDIRIAGAMADSQRRGEISVPSRGMAPPNELILRCL